MADTKQEQAKKHASRAVPTQPLGVGNKPDQPQPHPQAGERQQKKQNTLLDWLTFLVGVGTLAGVWYYAIYAKIQAGATKDTVTETRNLVKIADDTAKHQLRAYVLWSENAIELTAHDTYRVSMSLTNRGQTPAYNVTYWWESEIRSVSSAPQHVIDLPFQETGMISSDIDPGGEWPIEQLPKSISADDLQSVRNGTRALYVWGIIKYVDVFQRCQLVNFLVQNGREVQPGRWQFSNIEINNSSEMPCITVHGQRRAQYTQPQQKQNE